MWSINFDLSPKFNLPTSTQICIIQDKIANLFRSLVDPVAARGIGNLEKNKTIRGHHEWINITLFVWLNFDDWQTSDIIIGWALVVVLYNHFLSLHSGVWTQSTIEDNHTHTRCQGYGKMNIPT